jgi:invasion protein IalB
MNRARAKCPARRGDFANIAAIAYGKGTGKATLMTRRFGTLALSSAALGSALVVFAHQANAQKYDDDGQEPAATQDDDGFRPVWAQKQAPKAAPHDSRKSQSPLPHVAEQKPSPPLRTETTVYGRWTVTCQEANLDKDAKKTCAATLPVVDANKRLVLLWRLDSADGKVSLLRSATPRLARSPMPVACRRTARPPVRSTIPCCTRSKRRRSSSSPSTPWTAATCTSRSRSQASTKRWPRFARD